MVKFLKYYFYSALMLMNAAVITLAQETKHDVNIDIDVRGVQWYQQWWVWGIVAMLFIITIVALMTRGRRVS